MDEKEIAKLAELARIDMPGAEAEKLSQEFESILGYVGEIKAVTGERAAAGEPDRPTLNAMREDGETHESGLHTAALLAEAPRTKDGYVVVKKIL